MGEELSMPTREEAFQYIADLSKHKILTRAELLTAYDTADTLVPAEPGSAAAPASVEPSNLGKKLGIAEIMYYLGGAVVFLGVAIMLTQNWDTLGLFSKLLATLGAGLAAYALGLLLIRQERTQSMSYAFFLIAALVTPLGLSVLMDNTGADAASAQSQMMVAGAMLGMFLLTFVLLRRTIFLLFSVLFGTWFYFALLGLLPSDLIFADDSWRLKTSEVFAAAAGYLALGTYFRQTSRAEMTNFLYGFGSLGALGSALALGGWSPNQSVFWELVYPGLIFGALFASVRVKNKSFLTWGTIFFMFYILKITSEYFTEGLGWPLALVLAGLAMIGVGYVSLSVSRKYLKP